MMLITQSSVLCRNCITVNGFCINYVGVVGYVLKQLWLIEN